MDWVPYPRLEKGNGRIGSNPFDVRVEGRLFDARASMDHEAAAAVIFELASQIGQLIVAKVDFGRHMKGEICVGHSCIVHGCIGHGSLWH